MNQNQFIEFIHTPEHLNNQSVSLLKDIVTEFPYCQSARMLYLKNLHLENSIHFTKELKITAAYVSNRTRLYQLINLPVKTKPIVSNADTNIEQSAEVNSIFEPLPEAEVTKTTEFVKSENDFAISERIVENKTEDESTVKAASKYTELEEILRQRLAEIGKKEHNPQETTSNNQDVQQDKISIKTKNEIFHSDNELLQEDLNIKNKEIENPSPLDLINKFILQNPSIPRVKNEFYNVDNKSKKSLIDSGDIVSETLAKLYINKGNILKAIEIYQKLSLNFPKKSSYFAAEIEKIKKDHHLIN